MRGETDAKKEKFMPEIVIRKATRDDLDGLYQLYRVLFSEMAAFEPDYYKEADQNVEFIIDMIGGGESDILIAQITGNEAIAGFAVVKEHEIPEVDCLVWYRYTYLYDLMVQPHLRSAGVGKALLDAVKMWTKERGLETVELNAVSKNLRAENFYNREGFTELMKTMRCKI